MKSRDYKVKIEYHSLGWFESSNMSCGKKSHIDQEMQKLSINFAAIDDSEFPHASRSPLFQIPKVFEESLSQINCSENIKASKIISMFSSCLLNLVQNPLCLLAVCSVSLAPSLDPHGPP